VSEQTKQNLRQQIQAERAKKTPAELITAGKNIANHDWAQLIVGENIACYASWGNEPDTSELRRTLISAGKRVFLPIIKPNSQMLWGVDQPPYFVNKFGISEPEISEFGLESADAVILPALCADESGTRLGRGAGYFDRALANIPSFQLGGPMRIALLFDGEFLPTVPRDEHDELIDLVITPTRTIRCKTVGG
jgi:5-formyltetrahydrofolate cyclo-ligase